MTDAPTPLTDAAQADYAIASEEDYDVVRGEFARALERQLSALQTLAGEMAAALEPFVERLPDVNTQNVAAGRAALAKYRALNPSPDTAHDS